MNKLIILSLMFLASCGSHVTVHPRGCPYQTELMVFDPSLYLYEDQFKRFKGKDDVRDRVDFFFEYGVITPLGGLVDHRVYLGDVLKEQGLDCREVSHVAYSFQNTAYDMLLSLVPFFSRKTLLVYGKVRKEKLKEEKISVPKKFKLRQL